MASGGAARFMPAKATIPFNALIAAPAALNRMLARLFFPRRPAHDLLAEELDVILGARAIAYRVIPQLVASHRVAGTQVAARDGVNMTECEFDDFIQLLIANDMAACEAALDTLTASGATFDQLCLDLLTRAARRLGEMWEDDTCGFFEVTEGLGALHTLLHRCAERFSASPPLGGAPRRVLLASLPGEHHSFGLQMAGEMFRHAGWDVALAPETGEAELASLVAGGQFSVAGLSVADARQEGAVARAVQAIRTASANPRIGILLGGPVVQTRPDLAELLGADGTAADAMQAISRAEGLRVLMATLD
jgi:methylmalonyl-CoA mutase cobalamin-binding subunit